MIYCLVTWLGLACRWELNAGQRKSEKAKKQQTHKFDKNTRGPDQSLTAIRNNMITQKSRKKAEAQKAEI